MNHDELDFTDSSALRKRAEEKLQQQEQANAGLLKEADFKRVLHELQVHQIELEMQNEELVNAYEKVEASLKKYTMLYDLAPVGFFILGADGSIGDLNFTAASLLGDKRFTLLGSNFKLFVAEESLPQFNHFFNQVYESSVKVTCELNLGYDETPLGMVYMEGVVTGEDQECLLTIINLEQLKNNL